MMTQKKEFNLSRKSEAKYGWVSRAYGMTVGVCSDDERVLEQLKVCMPPGSTFELGSEVGSLSTSEVDSVFSVLCRSQSGSSEKMFELYKENRLLNCESGLDYLLEHFESAVGIFV